MIEALWIAGLLAAASITERRSLAVLVLTKGVVSYALFSAFAGRMVAAFGFEFPGEALVSFTDILIGTVAIVICLSRKSFRGDSLAILFVVFMLLHWLYWSAWEVGLWFADEYYVGLAFAYSLMVALLVPWDRMDALVDFARRSWLALRGLGRVFETPTTKPRRAPAGTRAERG